MSRVKINVSTKKIDQVENNEVENNGREEPSPSKKVKPQRNTKKRMPKHRKAR